MLGSSLHNHISRYLAEEPTEVFKDETSGVVVASFNNCPQSGLITYITVGVAKQSLTQGQMANIRQEYLITVAKEFANDGVQELLFLMAIDALQSKKALALGQVETGFGVLFPSISRSLCSLVVSYPAFFDEGFCDLQIADERVVFAELIPITEQERLLISQLGYDEFFRMIDEGHIAHLNYKR